MPVESLKQMDNEQHRGAHLCSSHPGTLSGSEAAAWMQQAEHAPGFAQQQPQQHPGTVEANTATAAHIEQLEVFTENMQAALLPNFYQGVTGSALQQAYAGDSHGQPAGNDRAQAQALVAAAVAQQDPQQMVAAVGGLPSCLLLETTGACLEGQVADVLMQQVAVLPDDGMAAAVTAAAASGGVNGLLMHTISTGGQDLIPHPGAGAATGPVTGGASGPAGGLGTWPQPSQSQSSSVGLDTSNVEQQQHTYQQDQRQQSGLRSSGANTGSNAGGNRGKQRKPHLQGRFSGRLATKDDEKRLNMECRLLGPLLGGVGKRGDGSRLTLAKIVRGIAAGDVRKFCEERERTIKHLKHRVSQLEAAAQQAEAMRHENDVLRQHLMEYDAAVCEGRSLPTEVAGAVIVDTAMPHACLQEPGMHHSSDPAVAAGASGGCGLPVLMDTSPNMLPQNGTNPHNYAQQQQQHLQAGASQLQGVPMSSQHPSQAQAGLGLRSMESFTGSVVTADVSAHATGPTAVPMQQHAAEPAQALPFPEGVKVVPLPVPPAAAAGAGSGTCMAGAVHPAAAVVAAAVVGPPGMQSSLSQGNMAAGAGAVGMPFHGSVPSLQGLAVRENSVEVSTAAGAPSGAAVGVAVAAATPMAMPVAIPARSHHSNDGGPGALMQLAGSASGPSPLGTSPAVGGPSPGLSMEEHAAAGHALGLMATSQAMVASGLPSAPGPAVGATTQAAVQVAQAAQAVKQQAASLHAAAEVHAAKAHAATSQVQSLQATAQVIAQTHEELVKKIEDVKQTAVAQIQQPTSMVPPEEVVKHAQIEVQKLEAQAQAQAIAAVQVSAAAQRAEAEAQKHLVVRAQVAAQAQELEQKAVNLEVHAEQLTTTAAATEAVVVAASGVGLGLIPTTLSPPLLPLGATSTSIQQVPEVLTSMGAGATSAGTQGPVCLPMPGVPTLTAPALTSHAAPAHVPGMMNAAGALVPTALLQQQQHQVVGPSAVPTTSPNLGVPVMAGIGGAVAAQVQLLQPAVGGSQPGSGAGVVLAMPLSQPLQTSSGVLHNQQGATVLQTVTLQPMVSPEQHQQPPAPGHPVQQPAVPAMSTLSGGQPAGSFIVGTPPSAGTAAGAGLSQQGGVQTSQAAHMEAAAAAATAAQQVAKLEAATAAAAVASYQQQAVAAQMEQAAAAAAAAQHAANLHAQQAVQLQAEHAAASMAAQQAVNIQQQQQAAAFSAAMQADAAAAKVAGAGVVAITDQQQNTPPLLQPHQPHPPTGLPPLPPGIAAMPRDSSGPGQPPAVPAAAGFSASGMVVTTDQQSLVLQRSLSASQSVGSSSGQQAMGVVEVGAPVSIMGMHHVGSSNSLQAMMQQQQQQQQAAMQEQQQQQASVYMQQQQQAALAPMQIDMPQQLQVLPAASDQSLPHAAPSAVQQQPGATPVNPSHMGAGVPAPGLSGAEASTVSQLAAAAVDPLLVNDPIQQQLHSRGGLDATSLDLEVLPQLDPLAVENMIGTPTPAGPGGGVMS